MKHFFPFGPKTIHIKSFFTAWGMNRNKENIKVIIQPVITVPNL